MLTFFFTSSLNDGSEAGAEHLDELIEKSGVLPMELAEILLRMEISGVIEKESAATYTIKRH